MYMTLLEEKYVEQIFCQNILTKKKRKKLFLRKIHQAKDVSGVACYSLFKKKKLLRKINYLHSNQFY